jgi:hypothetical protein
MTDRSRLGWGAFHAHQQRFGRKPQQTRVVANEAARKNGLTQALEIILLHGLDLAVHQTQACSGILQRHALRFARITQNPSNRRLPVLAHSYCPISSSRASFESGKRLRSCRP